jgi:diguanylate cyclase (GGDEF)-like protein
METTMTNHIDQDLLEEIPLGLLLLDRDHQIRWANRTLAEMLGSDPGALAGRRLADLDEPARQLLASEPQLFHDANRQRWMRRQARQTGDGERLLVLSDVSEQERLAEENARLRQQVEDLRLTDELTGMPNKRAISQALELHVSRSRRYQNPLSVVLVHVDLNPLSGVKPLSNDPVVLGVSRFLRDRLRWVDQIARWEEHIFLLVLPETTETDARVLLEKIGNEQEGMALPETYGQLRPRLTFGLACWQKGDDVRTLLRTALNDLREASGA